ncbi:hypothetical protein PIB30_080672, partial [Stylosanthes scabra]|nr:hypothetical protein [Stylosanthes scabra]
MIWNLEIGIGKRRYSTYPPGEHLHQEIILRIIVKVIGECHSSQIVDEVAGNDGYPRLSFVQANRVTWKQQLRRDEILVRKLGILNVIQAIDLSLELAYPLYIVASVD